MVVVVDVEVVVVAVLGVVDVPVATVLVAVLVVMLPVVWVDEGPPPVWRNVRATPIPTASMRTTTITATILVDIPLLISAQILTVHFDISLVR